MTAGAAPGEARTLGEALHAAVIADWPGVTFHTDGSARVLTLDELLDTAVRRATYLADRGVGRGDAVGLVGSNRPDWMMWAYGVWLSGAALVPLPVPIRVRDTAALREQLAGLAAGCHVVIAEPRYLGAVPEHLAVGWDVDTPTGSTVAGLPEVDGSDDALVLYTSGSTAVPKGVRMTHATFLRRSSRTILDPSERRRVRGVGWVPFFHYGGVLSVAQPVLDAFECNFLPPEQFARDPAQWLRLVGQVGATMTTGPSSAWAAAARAVARHPEGIDLCSLELALFAMEMVDPAVVERLLEVGGRLGLRPGAIAAAYGLSEGGTTATLPGAGIRIDRVDLTELAETGRALPAVGGRPAKRVASCGVPTSGFEVRIAGPDGALDERRLGDVLFRGPGLMDGYVGPDIENPVDQGWLRTGDLGYLAEGELFVTGRSKEVIVHQGRNYHPEDIEWAAARAEGVQPGGCVAFASVGAAEGEVVVAVEPSNSADAGDLRSRVRAAVADAVGLIPREILVVSRGAIPHAANGKLRRLAARDAHNRGELR